MTSVSLSEAIVQNLFEQMNEEIEAILQSAKDWQAALGREPATSPQELIRLVSQAGPSAGWDPKAFEDFLIRANFFLGAIAKARKSTVEAA